MTRERRTTLSLLCLSLVAFSSCSSASKKDVSNETGSGSAAWLDAQPLPSAAFGLYLSYYLAGGNMPSFSTALIGIQAQQKLQQGFNPMQRNDTFALLQELGNTLQIDIPDLLNRSPDRPGTLNTYVDALNNITERSRRTLEDLNTHVSNVRKDVSAQNSAVSQMQKQVDQAFRDNDYATAGSLQQSLADAKAKQASLQSEERQTRETSQTFDKLIKLAEKRQQAIAENREILIAGLKAVDLPGAESLQIIETSRSSRASILFQRE